MVTPYFTAVPGSSHLTFTSSENVQIKYMLSFEYNVTIVNKMDPTKYVFRLKMMMVI